MDAGRMLPPNRLSLSNAARFAVARRNEISLTDSFLASALNKAAIVASTNVKGDIIHCNDLFCEISGYSRDELMGANHRILNSGIHDQAFFVEMYRTIARGRCWSGTICNRSKSGELYWVDTTIVPQCDQRGRPVSYVSIRFDVTEHIKALSALAEARGRAEAAAQAKDRFLAKVSHELRTPLTGIIGITDLLERTALSDEQRQYAASIADASGTLQALVNDVLDLSSLEAGGVKILPAPTDLAALVTSTSALMKPRADEKALNLIVETRGLAPTVSVDALRLRQVMTNLLANAVKFSDAGFVAIEVAWEGDILSCSVRDSGPGFSIEDKDRLFKPFEQGVDTRDRTFGGAGLGLAISSDLVLAMGGRLEAESALGEGARFFFAIPAPACAQPTMTDSPTAAPVFDAGLSVLVAEDNPTIRLLLSRILEAAACQVTLAANGEEAVEAARAQHFDLCLMDLRMPKMDGFAAARAIRGLPECANLPVFAVSADLMDGRETVESTGDFSGFLSKPLRPDLILEMISSARPRAAWPRGRVERASLPSRKRQS